MKPLDAWLKLCKTMKEDELYLLKTFTVLNYPSLAYYAKMDAAHNLVFYGEPKMGGLKLTEPIVMGEKEFMALFPLYFSKELFSAKYSDIIPDAPFIFPLIEKFIVKEQQDLYEMEEISDQPKEDDDQPEVMSHEDDHLRSRNRNNNK